MKFHVKFILFNGAFYCSGNIKTIQPSLEWQKEIFIRFLIQIYKKVTKNPIYMNFQNYDNKYATKFYEDFFKSYQEIFLVLLDKILSIFTEKSWFFNNFLIKCLKF